MIINKTKHKGFRKLFNGFKMMFIVISILLVVTIFFAIGASAKGANLAKLEDESAKLTAENQELQDQIVAKSSLSQIEKQAVALGMGKPEKYIYINGNGIALR